MPTYSIWPANLCEHAIDTKTIQKHPKAQMLCSMHVAFLHPTEILFVSSSKASGPFWGETSTSKAMLAVHLGWWCTFVKHMGWIPDKRENARMCIMPSHAAWCFKHIDAVYKSRVLEYINETINQRLFSSKPKNLTCSKVQQVLPLVQVLRKSGMQYAYPGNGNQLWKSTTDPLGSPKNVYL